MTSPQASPIPVSYTHLDVYKRQVFASSQFEPMLRNTLGINILGQLVCLPTAIIFALLLNEIKHVRTKSLVQTATYLPHFLSWAIYGGLIKTLLLSLIHI